jgi:TonB-linked SusC/RagA family outer membrane protein
MKEKISRKPESLKMGYHRYLIYGIALAITLLSGNINALLANHFQEKLKITGVVVLGETNEPLVGANITIKGTITGTVSAQDGSYSIEASLGDVLVFSFIGTKTQERVVTSESKINVTLHPDDLTIDELVVIGYGVQRKSDLSGSVVSVNMDEVNKVRTTNALQALQGVAPGVSVITTSGAPGAGASILIRGITTLNDNDPLYIIDGVPGDFRNISQEEIESITIIKDASAAAIYGTRGAAGVVHVQTKRGKKGEGVKVSYAGNYNWQSPVKFLDMLTAEEYKKVYSMIASTDPNKNSAAAIAAAQAAGRPVGTFNGIQFAADEYAWNFNKVDGGKPVYGNTNWQDEMFRSAGTQQHTVVITGGTDHTNMSLSSSFTEQQGTMIGSDFTRGSVRFNSDLTKRWFKAGQSFSYNRRQGTNFLSTGPGQMFDILSALPHMQVNNNENKGGYGGPFDGMPVTAKNPIASALLPESTYSNDYLALNGYAEISFTKNLKYKFNAAYDVNNYYNFYFSPEYFVSIEQQIDKDYLSEERTGYNKWLVENLVTYSNTFADVHNVDVLLGYSAESSNSRNLYAKGEKLNNPEQPILMENLESIIINSSLGEEALASAFGRLSYSYQRKYHLQANVRRDGSSKFGKINRYGVFPSVSAAWAISRESFFNVPHVNDLKLRASYGIVGNDRIPNYLTQPSIAQLGRYVDGDNNLVLGFLMWNLAYDGLKWETTKTTNTGLDLLMFDNRLNFSTDYYIKRTDDILVLVPLTTSWGGATSATLNAADVRNKGFELLVGWKEKRGELFYNLGATFSTFNNEVMSLGSRTEPIRGGAIDFNVNPVTRTLVGGGVSDFWGYKTAGLFNSQAEIDEWNKQGFTDENNVFNPLQPFAQPGDIRFVDANGDGKLDEDDVVKLGSSLPKFEYSFNLGAQWKGFDVYAMFNGVYGNQIFNALRYRTERLNNYWNKSKSTLNAWTPQNTNTIIPRATVEDMNNNRAISDIYLESGSFLRLKTLQIGYTLPKSIVSSLSFDQCRVYVSGQNLLTLTSYSGYDPEVAGSGIFSKGVDWGRYPLFRSFIIGVDIKF